MLVLQRDGSLLNNANTLQGIEYLPLLGSYFRQKVKR